MPNKTKKKEVFKLNTSLNLKFSLCNSYFNLSGIKNQLLKFDYMLNICQLTARSFFLKGFQDVIQFKI